MRGAYGRIFYRATLDAAPTKQKHALKIRPSFDQRIVCEVHTAARMCVE